MYQTYILYQTLR